MNKIFASRIFDGLLIVSGLAFILAMTVWLAYNFHSVYGPFLH